MGLFSGIGKFFKGIWNGIKKVFSAVMKPVAKLLNSKLGKILMLAVTVFSMGTALLAGAQGFMSGTGFIGKFINGGKAFMNSLIGTNFAVEGAEAAGTAGAVAEGTVNVAGDAADAAGVLEGIDPTAAGGIAEATEVAGQVGPPAPLGPEGLAPGQMGPPTPVGAAVPDPNAGWLSKAMSAAKDFAKSDTGATVIGSTLQGYGRGQEIQAYLDEKSRVGRMFEDPNDPGMRMLREHDFDIDVSSGLAAAPGRLSQAEAQRTGRYAPTIPYRRPVVPVGG